MNKPSSFTAWATVGPKNKPSTLHWTNGDAQRQIGWWQVRLGISPRMMRCRGYRVRKILCTFVTPAKPTEGRT